MTLVSIQAGPAVGPITKGSIGTGVVEVGTLLVPYRVVLNYKVIVYWSETKSSQKHFGPSALQSFASVKFPHRLANATRLVAGISRRLRMTCFGLP